MTTNDYLTIESLYKSYGKATILKNISLSCKKGEFICLLGPSGCGKTTMLRIIAGLEEQDSGTLVQDAQDISSLPAQQRDFGIVFQSYALFPNLTVEKNIGYGLRKHPNKKERIRELINMVGLNEHAKKYPSQISGGQQQRVALARALAIEPNLLLLDEPLSALDAKVREHLRQEIKQLQQKLGVTTLMVTHDQEEAMSLADRIVVMNDGYIEQIGTPYEIYTHPATPFVADFVGKMNFIPANISENGELSCLGKAFDYTVAQITDSLEVKTGEINLGIRPEYVTVNKDSVSANSITVVIEKIEFCGAFVRLYASHENTPSAIIADVSSEQFVHEAIKIGNSVNLIFEQKHLRIYQTGIGS